MRRALIVAAALALAACGQVATNTEEAPGATDTQSPSALASPGAEFCEEIEQAVTPEECAFLNELARRVRPGWASFKAPETMQRGDTDLIVLAISRQAYEPPPPPETEEPAAAEDPTPAPEPEPTPAPDAAQPAPVDEEVAVEDVDDAVAPGGGPPAAEQEPAAAVVAPPEPAPTQTPRDMVETVPGVLSEFEPLTGRFMRANLNADVGFEITALSPAAQEVLDDSVTTWRWRVRATEDGARQLELETVVEGCIDDTRTRCYVLESTRYQHPVNVSVGWWGKFLDWLKGLPDILKIITAAVVALTSLVAAIFGLRAAFRKGRSSET